MTIALKYAFVQVLTYATETRQDIENLGIAILIRTVNDNCLFEYAASV